MNSKILLDKNIFWWFFDKKEKNDWLVIKLKLNKITKLKRKYKDKERIGPDFGWCGKQFLGPLEAGSFDFLDLVHTRWLAPWWTSNHWPSDLAIGHLALGLVREYGDPLACAHTGLAENK